MPFLYLRLISYRPGGAKLDTLRVSATQVALKADIVPGIEPYPWRREYTGLDTKLASVTGFLIDDPGSGGSINVQCVGRADKQALRANALPAGQRLTAVSVQFIFQYVYPG
jgi:hypothetical protein